MRIDYRSFLDKIWEAMPAAEYVAMASDPHVLGNPLLKTQHFIGSSKWEYVSETEAIGWHQLRVPHQRYTDESRKEVAIKGHAHGSNQHWYKKIGGVWKFAGLAPIIRWGEFDFEGVFANGRETFGEQEKMEEQVAVAAGVSAEVGDSQSEVELTSYTQSAQLGTPALPQGTAHLSNNGFETEPAATVEVEKPVKLTSMPTVTEETRIQSTEEDNAATQQTKMTEQSLPDAASATAEFSNSPVNARSEEEQVQLMQMAKEDGKLFEMQVEEIPIENVHVRG